MAKIFNGLHQSVVFVLVGSTVLLSGYLVKVLYEHAQQKKMKKLLKASEAN